MHNIVKDYGKLGKRASHAITHNKINKHAMHLVRLMKCCIEILKTGDFSTYREADHELLMDIRNGKYMGEDGQMTPEFNKLVESLEKEMDKAFENTTPEKPDMQKINQIVCTVNEMLIREQI